MTPTMVLMLQLAPMTVQMMTEQSAPEREQTPQEPTKVATIVQSKALEKVLML